MIENHLRKPVGFCRNSRIAKFLVEAASGLFHCSEMEACSGPRKCRKGSAGHSGIKCERNACSFNSRLNRESTERASPESPVCGSTDERCEVNRESTEERERAGCFNSRLNRESTERPAQPTDTARCALYTASIHGSTERALKGQRSRRIRHVRTAHHGFNSRLNRESTESLVRRDLVDGSHLASIHGSTERALKARFYASLRRGNGIASIHGSTERALKVGQAAVLVRPAHASIHGSTERALKDVAADHDAPSRRAAGFNSRLNRESTESAGLSRCWRCPRLASIHGSTERALKVLPLDLPVGVAAQRFNSRLNRESTERWPTPCSE